MRAPDVGTPGAGVGAGGRAQGQETQQDCEAVHLSMQVEGATFPAYTGTREAWCYAILDFLRPKLAANGIVMPEGRTVRVGVLPLSRGRLGVCHPSKHSSCGTVNFIGVCTKQADARELVHTLAHEFLHACDDCQSGHRHRWKRWAASLGMAAKGHERNAEFEGLITAALRAVGVPAAHVPSTTAAAASAMPSQQRLECLLCGMHAYVPRLAAISGYHVLCGDCELPMAPVDRSTKARRAARTSA